MRVATKDPTVVFHEGAWHVFATVRMNSGWVDIKYLRFTDWVRANQAPRHVLALRGDVFRASHTCKLKGRLEYLTIVQAQGNKRCCCKAYFAARLEGPWQV